MVRKFVGEKPAEGGDVSLRGEKKEKWKTDRPPGHIRRRPSDCAGLQGAGQKLRKRVKKRFKKEGAERKIKTLGRQGTSPLKEQSSIR